jgi:hypothetical protein
MTAGRVVPGHERKAGARRRMALPQLLAVAVLAASCDGIQYAIDPWA